MYTIFRWIFAALDIQFFFKSSNSLHIYRTQILVEFSLFQIFNFSANLDVPYIYNVHNFPLNFRSYGYSIFLQMQTFRTHIMYTISRWIYAVLDIQIFWKFRYSAHTMYTVCRWIFAIMDIQFFCKSKHSVHI